MKTACSKRQYTKREAETIRNLRLRSGRKRPDVLRIYHCDVCNCYHMTHQESREVEVGEEEQE